MAICRKNTPSQQDKQLCHVEVFGETNLQQVMTSYNISNFLTHLMIIYDLVTSDKPDDTW